MSLFIKTLTLSNFVFWLVFFLLYRNGNFDSAMNSKYLYADSYTNSMDSIPPKDSAIIEIIDLSCVESHAVVRAAGRQMDEFEIMASSKSTTILNANDTYIEGIRIINKDSTAQPKEKIKKKRSKKLSPK